MTWPIVIAHRVGERDDGHCIRPVYQLPDGSHVTLDEAPVGMAFQQQSDGDWCIKLPGGHNLFGPWTTRASETGQLWDVNGDMPRITVTPSIDCVGVYHGHISNGVISDDVEGRAYDAQGRLT